MENVYKDEYTQEPLARAWEETAINDELDYVGEHVWVCVPMEEAMMHSDANIVGCRWVVCNKNDQTNPDVRARLVAQELNLHGEESFSAATPPLESKRVLFSQWASEKVRDGQTLKLSFIDVKKAYFHGRPARTLFVRLPPELGYGREMLARLDRCMYGCRDSGAIWEEVYSNALKEIGVKQGAGSPCCFYHPRWNLACVVHGDDFTCLGTDASLSLSLSTKTL